MTGMFAAFIKQSPLCGKILAHIRGLDKPMPGPDAKSTVYVAVVELGKDEFAYVGLASNGVFARWNEGGTSHRSMIDNCHKYRTYAKGGPPLLVDVAIRISTNAVVFPVEIAPTGELKKLESKWIKLFGTEFPGGLNSNS